MAEKHCDSCQCNAQPPVYPLTCEGCGVSYGPGGEVANHRKDGMNCRTRAGAKK